MDNCHVGLRNNENIVFKLWGHKELCSVSGVSLQGEHWGGEVCLKKLLKGLEHKSWEDQLRGCLSKEKEAQGKPKSVLQQLGRRCRITEFRTTEYSGRVPQESSSPTQVDGPHRYWIHNLGIIIIKLWPMWWYGGWSLLPGSKLHDEIKKEASNCARGNLDWIWGKISTPKELPNFGTGFPGKWLSPYCCRYLKDLQLWCLATLFSGGLGRAELMAGPYNLQGLFQP